MVLGDSRQVVSAVAPRKRASFFLKIAVLAWVAESLASFLFGGTNAISQAAVWLNIGGLILSLLSGLAAATRRWNLAPLWVGAILGITLLLVIANLDANSLTLRSMVVTALTVSVATTVDADSLAVSHSASRFLLLLQLLLLCTPMSSLMYSTVGVRDGQIAILSLSRFQGILVSPNTQGFFLGALIVVELIRWRRSKTAISRALQTSVIAASTVLLLQTGSTTAMAATVAALICVKIRRIWLQWSVVVAAIVYAASPYLIIFAAQASGQLTAAFDPQYATNRGAVWQRASELLEAWQLWGVSARYSFPGEVENQLVEYGGGHAHNVIIQVWLWGGLPLVLFVLGAAVVGGARQIGTKNASIAVIVFLALSSFAEVPIVVLPGSVNGLIVVLLFYAARSGGMELTDDRSSGTPRRVRQSTFPVGHISEHRSAFQHSSALG